MTTDVRRACVLAALVLVGCDGSPRRDARQAIVILLDAARPDRFSAYGYARETTPNVDALARNGVVFTSAFAQGTHTREALPALLYSRYFVPPLFPGSVEVPFAAPEELFQRADAQAISLPRALSGAGFHTAAISAHSWIGEHSKLAAEFDEFQDLSTRLTYPKRYFHPRGEQVVDVAIDWIGRHRDEDFFLYLHLMDTHTPHYFEEDARRWFQQPGYRPEAFDAQGRPIDVAAPLAGADRAYLDALYDGGLRYVDGQLGRLFERLRRWGTLDRTLIVITADHGEALLDHPGRFGHGGEWYDEVGHIPLIVHLPARVSPNRVPRFAEQVDVAPTMLALLGVATPAGKRLDGIDLFGAGTGGKDQALMARGIRTARYKALVPRPADLLTTDGTAPADAVQLFDLDDDPGETRDLGASRPDVVADLVGRYRAALGARYLRSQQARATDPPSSPFAIASDDFATRPAVSGVRGFSTRTMLANLGPGSWLKATQGSKSALVARGSAAPLDIEFPLPNGTYVASLGIRGACRLELMGAAGRDVVAPEVDLDATPNALWRIETVSVGPITVTDERFRATVRPTSRAFVLRYIGFDPGPVEAPRNGKTDAERTERLRGLGYVE